LVRDRLIDCGLTSISGRRVVLTGGGSQMNGAREIATRVLSKQVRLGRPTRLTGHAEQASGPAFAGVAGLSVWAAQRPGEIQHLRDDGDLPLLAYGTTHAAPNGLKGLTRWIKENF
jgi:cell division protein FtsA